MSPKPRTTPRKAPRQERAKATVEAILEATARVFLREGYDRTSTNKIARAAGVSVGSLYQYFPSKEALAAALIDRHMAEMEGLLAVSPELAQRPLAEIARHVVRGMLAAHQVHPRLHHILMDQVPRVGRLEKSRDLDARACQLVRGLLELKRGELRSVDLDLATFVITSTVEAITHKATMEHPEYIADPRLEEEIVQLVLRYLGASEAKVRAAG